MDEEYYTKEDMLNAILDGSVIKHNLHAQGWVGVNQRALFSELASGLVCFSKKAWSISAAPIKHEIHLHVFWNEGTKKYQTHHDFATDGYNLTIHAEESEGKLNFKSLTAEES